MLVGPQVQSIKGGKKEGGELFNKILLAWTENLCQLWGQPGIVFVATKGPSPEESSPEGPSPEGPSPEGPSPEGSSPNGPMDQAQTPKLRGSGSPLCSFRIKIEIKT